jgi:hypothetical protein
MVYIFNVWICSEFEVVSLLVTCCLHLNVLLIILFLTQFGVGSKYTSCENGTILQKHVLVINKWHNFHNNHFM